LVKNTYNKTVLDDVSNSIVNEIEVVLNEGLDAANKMIEESESKTNNEQLVIESQQVKESDIKSRQILGAAEIQSRNSTLKLLEKNINNVFTTALKELSKDKGKNYQAALAAFIEEGLSSIDSDDVLISCNKQDNSVVKTLVSKLSAKHKRNISVSDEPLKTSGGVIVSNLDDTISVNNTIEARLERMKAELRTDIVNKFK
jgi:V/A-type H+-transporting ATPase subunit E|tara:strand:- start:2205 stop:2807 length:603 start_codon:yes stop_codon:yes gene_type:complete